MDASLRSAILLLALFAAPGLAGCLTDAAHSGRASHPCPEETTHAEGAVPECVRASAASFVEARMGEFARHAALNESATRFVPAAGSAPARYDVGFDFRVPEAPWVDVLMTFRSDTAGNVLVEEGVHGVPECGSKPGKCWFPVDAAKAEDVARKAGLKEGVAPWRTTFDYWGGGASTEPGFAWLVESTLRDDASGASGRGIVVDANAARVLHRYEWPAP